MTHTLLVFSLSLFVFHESRSEVASIETLMNDWDVPEARQEATSSFVYYSFVLTASYLK